MGNDDLEDFDVDIDLGDADDGFFNDANEDDGFPMGGNNFGDMTDPADMNSGGAGQYQMPSDYTPQNGFNNTDYSEEDDTGATKRKALIIGGIGVIIVLLVVTIAGIVLNKGKGGNKKPEPVVREEVQMPQNSNTQNNNTLASTTSGNGWTEVDPDTSLKFSEELSGTFTPTSVRHYVKTTTSGELEIKSVCTGSISGLTGTYELEIPYSQACLLQRGNYFSITYKMAEMNGQQIISDIVY